MSLRRFYVDPGALSGAQARVRGRERDHMVRVLRLGPGDEVVLFDGRGWEYPARILEAGRREVSLEVRGRRPAAAEPGLARVILLQAVPRLSRMDWLVEKATEAGVAAVVPVLARRSPPEARRAGARLTRWRTIAREACRQCGRSAVPDVEPPLGASEAWGRWSSAARRAALDPAAGLPLKEWLELEPASEWVLAVGPEGGWDPGEIEEARQAGFECVALGPRTLRAETAGVLVVAAVQFVRGDLGSGARAAVLR